MCVCVCVYSREQQREYSEEFPEFWRLVLRCFPSSETKIRALINQYYNVKTTTESRV